MGKSMTTQFRKVLGEPGILVVPGAYDCLSAKLAEEAGFKAIFHGGYNSAACLLGMPDVGLISMSESVGHARNMAAAVNIPVVCDVDTGFGNSINVIRTTREVIRSGLAGLYIEDQMEPKRCPGFGEGDVIGTDEMRQKLRAALRVRDEENHDFVIIARTYSGRVRGMEEAGERCVAYAEEGADMVFVDLGYTDKVVDEIRVVVDRVKNRVPIIITMAETVGRPLLPPEELERLGIKLVLYPLTAVMTAAGAIRVAFKELREKGTTKEVVDRVMPFKDVGRLLGIERVREIEKELEESSTSALSRS